MIRRESKYRSGDFQIFKITGTRVHSVILVNREVIIEALKGKYLILMK